MILIDMQKEGLYMYCRYCGKKIEDDSVYCKYCGKKLSERNAQTQIQEEKKELDKIPSKPNPDSVPKEKTEHWFLLISIPILMVIVILIVGGIGTSLRSSCRVVDRTLTSSDYTYTTSQDLTSYSITITPNTSIKTCEIELKLYDSSGKLLFSDTQTKESLKKGNSYTYTFNFGFVNSFSGSYVRYNVTGKV